MNYRSGSVQTVQAFANCDVPIIGAINGVAAGGGFGLALCCDVRIFAESARIGSIFIKRGIAADYGAAYWLPRIVGVPKAFELFYDGNVVDSATALELGLATASCPTTSSPPRCGPTPSRSRPGRRWATRRSVD